MAALPTVTQADVAIAFAAYQREISRPSPFVERLVGAVSPARQERMMRARVGMAHFRYEAAQINRLRSWHGNLQLPPESNATKIQRTQMLMAGREAAENDPIFNGLLRKMEVYTVGNLRRQSDTGDEALDAVLDEYINERWWNDCEVSGRFSFQDIARLAVRERCTVGQMGLCWVTDTDGELRLMLIEGDRIGHPYASSTEKNYLNGIIVNELGRPVAYEIFQRDTQSAAYNNPQRIPAEFFVHYYDITRPDVYNGVTPLHSILNPLIDFREMMEAMRIKIKSSSTENFFATTLSGLPAASNILQGTSLPGQTRTPGQEEVTTFGRVRYGAPGEKFEQIEANFPAPQVQQAMETVIRTCANAWNISYGLLRNMAELTGPGARAELAQDDREFDLQQTTLEEKVLVPVVNRAIYNAALRGRIPGANPLDPRIYRGIWHFPSKLTIDLGKDAQADVLMNDNALSSAADICGRQGKDWRQVKRQCVKEAKFLQDEANKAGVPVEQVQKVMTSVSGRDEPAPGDEGGTTEPADAKPALSKFRKRKKVDAKK